MKPITIASLVLLGTLALGNYHVRAQGGPEFLNLNFNLYVQQQALNEANPSGDGKTYLWTMDKTKVGNKTMLSYMAEIFNTNWPAGARLRYSGHDDQVVVTDKTGTNVIFYCGDGVNNANRQAYMMIDWYYDQGPYKGKVVDAIPGSEDFTGYWRGMIGLYYENFDDETVYLDLYGDGLNVENYLVKMTTTNGVIAAQENFTPFVLGMVSEDIAVMTGKITAKGRVTGGSK